ncbi:MAG: phenylalanine--tRNA ligase subunit beta [Patescibacteria group bacterium]
MKISYNWLKNYLDLKERPEKVAEALTMGIAEVESVEEQGKGLENVVIGEILEIKKHPNADKLNVAKVNIGKKTIQVIFGQVVSLKVGDRLPIVVAPAILPSGLNIEKKKLRGVESEGMCCLDSELGIFDKARKVTFFGKEIKPGTPLVKALGLDDTVLEIDNKSLTHRADLFSHIGIARELAAILGKKLKLPKLKKPKEIKEKKLKVKVENFNDCPRYMDVVLDNIKIEPSPEWMQKYLKTAGIRPINNVVDITNFIMLEYGHPTHAFDYDKIKDQTFHIRKAKKGEKIVTLDGVERNLDESVLIIEDTEKITDLAGIMGGAISEVDKKTKTIVLEAANFDKTLIRKTAQKLGLHTEAVVRYEKGLSLDLTRQVLWRGVELLEKYAGAKIASKVYDLKKQLPKKKKIKFDLNYLNKLTGMKIPRQKVIKILKSLEFEISSKDNILNITIPLFRTDINLKEDLVEEVARLYGYGKIKPLSIFAKIMPVSEFPDLYWSKRATAYLTDWGFDEIYNYSFYGEKLLAKCKLTSQNHFALKNPLSPDLSFLRTSLLPWLLENLEKNSRQFSKIKIFEIGHVFIPGCESKMLSGMIYDDDKDVFYKARGVVELLFKKLNIPCKFENLQKQKGCEYWNLYKEGQCLQIKSGSKYLGTISEVDAEVLEHFDLAKRHVSFFDLFFEEIAKLVGKPQKFIPLPKYPPIILDLAFVLDKKIPAADILKTIYAAGKPLLTGLELFDVYEGKPLLPSQKNLAFRLTYQSPSKTLKDSEVKSVQDKIVGVLEKKFGAKVRKF